ncbi:unnamed protein product [Choristocarpus tenellus]
MAQAVEAHRQREFMEKKQNELLGKLSDAKATAIKQQRTKLNENSALISECNYLRKENVTLKRQNDSLRQDIKEANARVNMAAATSNNAGVRVSIATPESTPGGGLGSTLPHQVDGEVGIVGQGVESPSRVSCGSSMATASDSGILQNQLGWGESIMPPMVGPVGKKEKPDQTTTPVRSLLDFDGVEEKRGGQTWPETAFNGGAGRPPHNQGLSARWQDRPGGQKHGPGAEHRRRSVGQLGSLTSSASANSLLQTHQRRWQQGQRQTKGQRQRGPLLSSSAGGRGTSEAHEWRLGGRGVVGCGLVKGNTRALHTQATQLEESLRLERELDEKEREIHMQRSEIHTLREHLRLFSRSPGQSGNSSRHENVSSGGEQDRSPQGTPPTQSVDSLPVSQQTRQRENAGVRTRTPGDRMGTEVPPPGAHVPLQKESGEPRGEANLDLTLSATGPASGA